jgi:hypothetical protein
MQHDQGTSMGGPDPRSPTKRELYERARELGVERRSRMSKAELAEAVARKELDEAPTMASTARSARMHAQHPGPSVEWQVRAVAQHEAQAVVEELRESVRAVAQQEAQSAVERARETVRAVAQQEAQSAVGHVRGEVQSASQDSGHGPVRPLQAAVQWSRSRLRRFATAVLLPVFLALITSIVASNYVSSRVFDRAFLGGTDPVTTKAFYDRDMDVQGLTWALPQGLGQLPPDEEFLLSTATNSVDEFNAWIRERGGVDVGYSFIKLIVTGQRHRGVVITDMQAKPTCRAPLNGALLYAPAESERENIQLGFNLDEKEPIAREGNSDKKIGERGYLGRDYFNTHTVPISLGEDQVFRIVAATERHYCSWFIDMTILADDRTRHVTVGYKRDGEQTQRPFEITALLDPRTAEPGLSTYNEFYRLQQEPNPAGFTLVDPRTYGQ